MADLVGITAGAYHRAVGILVAPITTSALTLEVSGMFYTPELVQETDTSYWASAQPELLIMAASRCLEVSHRNQQGVNDWDSAIGQAVTSLELDHVQEESFNISRMEG